MLQLKVPIKVVKIEENREKHPGQRERSGKLEEKSSVGGRFSRNSQERWRKPTLGTDKLKAHFVKMGAKK
jgi:hypothetical protein